MKGRFVSTLLVGLLGLSLMLSAQGPKSSSPDTVARPKKDTTPAADTKNLTLPPLPSEFRRNPNQPEGGAPSFRGGNTTVTLDVGVVDKDGNFIPNLPKEVFRITEDKVPQTVATLDMGEAPITIALVIEFSTIFQQYGSETWYQTLASAIEFLNLVRPEDYVAIVAYDLRPEILSDFSRNRKDAADAMNRLQSGGFSETVFYDSITQVAERMKDIEGRKAVVLISSGYDTVSQITFGTARKRLQAAGVPIYTIGLMDVIRTTLMRAGALDDDILSVAAMADSQLRTFSKETGGQAYFPSQIAQSAQYLRNVVSVLRSQYVLSYSPTNSKLDGKFRKLKVELIDPKTNKELKITDSNGNNVKYTIVTKDGYTARNEVE